jgi:hypothetical protein
MTDQDLARDFQSKCSVSETTVKTENDNDSDDLQCSFCESRAYMCVCTAFVQPLSHSRYHFEDVSLKTHEKPPRRKLTRRDSSSVPSELLLRGAMMLQADGKVLGEIKGQIFCMGEEELLKGGLSAEAYGVGCPKG